MANKQVKLRAPNGEVITISVPAGTTPDQIQAWTKSGMGRETIRKSRRNTAANNFSRLEAPKPDAPVNERTISRGQAYGGQALHAADKLGTNLKSFMDDYVPGVQLVDDAVNLLPGGKNRQDRKADLDDRVSQGQAFVDKTREQGYSNVGGTAVNTAYHLMGALAPPLKTARLPFLANTMGQGGVQTGLGGVGAEDGKRLAEGTASGAGSVVADLLMGALARTAKPIWKMTKPAKKLADKGIYATPLSSGGPGLKALEDKFLSVPGIGDALQMGRRQGVRDYNAHLITNTAGPIKGKQYGTEAFDEALTNFSGRYDNALKDLNLNVNDPSIQSSINSVVRNNELDKSGIDAIDRTWNTYRANHNMGPMPITGFNTPGVSPQQPFGQSTLIDGEDIQRLTQIFTNKGKKFQRSADPFQSQTGDAYLGSRDALMDAVSRQGIGTGDVNLLKGVNKDYARFSPVMDAANRAGASRNDGVFSPGEGLSALQQSMAKRGKSNQFLRGKGDNQDIHKAANKVLGSAYPDSGTAGRLAVTSLVLGGGGMGASNYLDNPSGFAPLAALAAYTAATATKGGRKYMLGRAAPKMQDLMSDVLRSMKLRKGVSAVGASDTGENPSVLSPDIYTPWKK